MSSVFRGDDENIILKKFSELPDKIKVYIATQYTSGNSIPAGGLENQYLKKQSNSDFDTIWSYLPNLNFGSKSYNGSEELSILLSDLCSLIEQSDIDKLFKETNNV